MCVASTRLHLELVAVKIQISDNRYPNWSIHHVQ